MVKVKVVRYQRKERIHDQASASKYYLRQQAKDSKIFDIGRIANDLEISGSLSSEDVVHAIHAVVRRMRKILRDGNRIKVQGLGTFFLSFECEGAETPEECTIKNIGKIHIRFEEEKTKHFVNASRNPAKEIPENVEFEMVASRKCSQ